MDNNSKKKTPHQSSSSSDPQGKKSSDPMEQAIKYKAYRHIFSAKDVGKGLDEKTILNKIKKSKTLAGRYQQYVEAAKDGSRPGGKNYPWQNPFNKAMFWAAYWLPRFFKWGAILTLCLWIINYIPGPTQHIIEFLVVRSIYDTAPVERLPENLESYAHSADIKDSAGAVIKSYGKRRVTGQVPPAAQKALLACEDQYFLPHKGNPWYVNAFLTHPGVSWLNLLGAVKDTLLGNTRGASTVAMQNAKKIIGNEERTIANKLEEIVIAYMMVSKFGKERTLNFYINTVPVGANLHGFPVAAESYFKKDLSELNMQQLVAIGSFIPNHNRQLAFYEIINGKNFADLSPAMQGHAASAINKVNSALRQLVKWGDISEEQYRAWRLSDEDSIRRIGFRDFRSPLYGEEEWTSWNVIKEVSSRTYTVDGRKVSGARLLLEEKGDVVIETGINLALTEKMKEIVKDFIDSEEFRAVLRASNAGTWQRDQERYLSRNQVPPYKDFESFLAYLQQHVNIGIVSINQKGEVVAYVGGKEFLKTKKPEEDESPELAEPDPEPEVKDHKAVIIDLMSKKAKLAPSSTIKPIIAYYAMLVNNTKIDDRFADKPLEYKYLAREGRHVWMPRNWYNYDSSHPMGREYSLLDAQVISINTIFARLYTDPLIRNTMLQDFDKIGLDYSREDSRYWPFGIGASQVPVQQWLGVYNAFLDGNYREPSFVRRILINGRVIYARDQDENYAPVPLFESKKERDAEMAALYEICNRGTASAMKSEFKQHKNLVSGKTGTAPMSRSALFISHFNPYRDRQRYPDSTITTVVTVTTNTGGYKSVGGSSQAPVKVAGRIYKHLFQNELQTLLDKKLERAKQQDAHFRNNHVYWANVNRYLDTLLNDKCGDRFIHENIVGADGFSEALEQILNSNSRIYTGQDQIFSQLVDYYCDQQKMVKMEPQAESAARSSGRPVARR